MYQRKGHITVDPKFMVWDQPWMPKQYDFHCWNIIQQSVVLILKNSHDMKRIQITPVYEIHLQPKESSLSMDADSALYRYSLKQDRKLPEFQIILYGYWRIQGNKLKNKMTKTSHVKHFMNIGTWIPTIKALSLLYGDILLPSLFPHQFKSFNHFAPLNYNATINLVPNIKF